MKINNKDHGNKMLSGAMSLTVSVLIVKLIGFLYKLPLSRVLGDEGMGYFNSAYTVFVFFYMLATGGIPKAVSMLVTDANVKKGRISGREILAACLTLFLFIGAFLCLGILLFGAPIAKIIGNPDAALSLLLISPAVLFVCISGVLRGFLTGNKRLGVIAISEVIEGAVKFVFGLAFAMYGAYRSYPIRVISALAVSGVSVGSMLSMIFLLISSKKQKREDKAGQSERDSKDRARIYAELFRFAIPITVTSAIMGLSSMLDLSMFVNRLVAGGTPRREAIALYGNYTTLAVPMLNLVSALLSSVSSSALPELRGAVSSHSPQRMRDVAAHAISVISFFAAPAALASYLYSKELLSLLFTEESALKGAAMLSALSPSMFFLPLLTFVNTVLEAGGKTKIPLVSMSVAVAVKSIISYFALADGRVGALAAPLSTSVSYLVALAISMLVLATGVKIPSRSLLAAVRPCVCAFISIGFVRILYNYSTNGAYYPIAFIVSALASAAIYFILLLVFNGDFWRKFAKFVNFSKLSDTSMANITKEGS